MSIALQRTRSIANGRLGSLLLLLALCVVLFVVGQRVLSGGLSFFIQILVFGLANGAIYGLVALGYTMVYGIIELINFAHGDVFTLGAYIGTTLLGFFAITEGTFTTVNIIALLLVFPVVIDRAVMVPIMKTSPWAKLISSMMPYTRV